MRGSCPSQVLKSFKMLSVVIATIGGPELEGTIRRLNEGSVRPDEILVCLPAGSHDRAASIEGGNVRALICRAKGQVPQRAEGFTQVAGELVLQLDDDIALDYDCLGRLRDALETLPGKAAVAPLMLDQSSATSVYKREMTLKRKLFFALLNGREGFQPGQVAQGGFGMGVEPGDIPEGLFQVGWLPGGCALHRKENLVSYNFFPFQGKAFCEDLMHSAELSRCGVSLHMVAGAQCRLDAAPVFPESFAGAWREFRADMRARMYYLRKYARPSGRIAFYAAARASHLAAALMRRRFPAHR